MALSKSGKFFNCIDLGRIFGKRKPGFCIEAGCKKI
jgi:hypothetical protein